nr:MAG TPA: tail protein [Caudoviricetes sp.]
MAEKYDKNDLQTQFEGIRDERRLAANTAYRIGNAFLSLLHFASDEMKAIIEELLKKTDGQYLSKVNDDQAAGLINFLKGLKVGEIYSFDAAGNIIASSIKADSVTADKLASSNFNEGEQKGFTVAVKDAETGKYRLCIDELLAWGLATMKQLHVKGDSTFDGNLFSKEFISGFLGGKGWGIYNKPITNAAGMQENKWTGEFDNVIVRGSLRVYEMIISQLLGENDNRIFTGMMEVDHYDPESGKIYLDTQNGKLYNPFRKDDIILVQQYNGMPNSSNDYYVTKSYELIISEAGCGSTADGEHRLDWVKFESFSSSMENATPASCIKPKDTLVRVDNLSDPDRKGIMQIITVGSGAPYLDVLYGMKTDPNNALKGRLGNLQGIKHPIFGQLSGFGEFLQNLYATGDFILRRTGESIDTKIQMLQNQFATRFAQTSYDVTEENNYLHNGQFLTVTGTDEELVIDGWTVDENEDTEFWVDANGLPVMVNGSATVSGNHRVSIDNVEGRNVLHIENSGLKQSNSIVRKPGTHKEYDLPSSEVEADKLAKTSEAYKEVQDKLYVTAIVYAKTTGQLTIGFEPCTAVSGKVNELASRTIDVAYSAEWQTIKFEGKWNGTGDFILRYSGDMLISMITITDEPLSNLSKTVSTQILQTAANIKLLGSNIDNVQGTVTKLGIELDAEKKSIRLYVAEENKKLKESLQSEIKVQAGRIDAINSWQSDTETKMSGLSTKIDEVKLFVTDEDKKLEKSLESQISMTKEDIMAAVGKAATKEELTDAKDTLSSEMASNDKAVREYIDGIDSDIRSDYGTTVSLVKQKSDSWSVAAGAFYSDGTLRECGGLSVSTYFTNLFNKKITLDSSGNVKNISKSGLLVKADKTELETKISNVDGKIISSATIETMISNGISEASIRADQISLEGVVTANKYFKINLDGSMHASAGQIAGLKIEGEGLTNKGFDNDAYIVLRNDSHKVFAGIGGNVLPASTGTRAVARFTNEESSKFFGDVNYSVVCGAKGAVTNVALDMTLGGYVAGLRIKNAYMSSGGSTYRTAKDIDKNVHSVLLAGAGYYKLPKMEKWDDGYVIFIKRTTNSGAVHLCSNVSVTIDAVTAKDKTGTSFIYYDSGSGTTDLEIESSGDAMMLVYHRDMSFTVTENNKEKKCDGGWIQYKCPRDW